MYRSGFVSIIGRPNVGKSTFLNTMVGFKAAIISDKPQTTRNLIRAVLTTDSYQVVFVDTPGIHKPKHKLGNFMVNSARNTIGDGDVVLFMADACEKPGKGDRFIIDLLQEIDAPVFLVLNKTDLVTPEVKEERLEAYGELYPFHASFAISALYAENIAEIVSEIVNYLPEGPQYYPPEMVTDNPEYFTVSEIIREKVLNLTREEVPFSVAVDIEDMSFRENRDLIDIMAVIYVERPSQKSILIGKGGKMLREVGARSRPEIEEFLGSQVYLDLWVKVNQDWRNRQRVLNSLGYRDD